MVYAVNWLPSSNIGAYREPAWADMLYLLAKVTYHPIIKHIIKNHQPSVIIRYRPALSIINHHETIIFAASWPWFWWLPTILAVHWGCLQMSCCTLAQTTAFPGSFGMVMLEVSAVANLKLQKFARAFSWSWDIKTYQKLSLNSSNHQPHKLLKDCTAMLKIVADWGLRLCTPWMHPLGPLTILLPAGWFYVWRLPVICLCSCKHH